MAWTTAMRWHGEAEYGAAPEVLLKFSVPHVVSSRASNAQVILPKQKSDQNVDKSLIGTIKSARNFTLIKVTGGSHAVPVDRPDAALDILQRWVAGEWWEAS
jgi:carboxypeptidase C (cathepsin A)